MTGPTTLAAATCDGPNRGSRARPGFPGAITVVRAALFLACALALMGTQADPDLWGHVRFGGDIVAGHAVSRTDPYSFTSDRPWVNHEWLAEVLMFGAYRLGGSFGLVALKLTLDVALVLLVLFHLKPDLPAAIDRDRFVALLVLGIMPRALTVRPQLFSLLLFGVLLSVLLRADRGQRRALFLVPAVMMVWANLHGGWLVGMATFAVWVGVRLIRPGPRSPDRAVLVVVGLGAAAATLINPYGIGLWSFLQATAGMPRPDIGEWTPMYRLPAAQMLLFMPVLATAIYVVVRRWRTVDRAYLGVVVMLGVATLLVSRLDAFFAIAVVMLLGREVVRRTAVVATALGVTGERRGPTGLPRFAVLAFAIVGLVVMPAWVAAHRDMFQVGLQASFLPEPAAARFVLLNRLHGRMITWFDWGEYAIWHFGPRLKVSLDGRRETVYSIAALRANYDFCNGKPGAAEWATRQAADYAWLPNGVPACALLEAHGWRRVFRGPISSVFARPGNVLSYSQPPDAAGSGVFPGP